MLTIFGVAFVADCWNVRRRRVIMALHFTLLIRKQYGFLVIHVIFQKAEIFVTTICFTTLKLQIAKCTSRFLIVTVIRDPQTSTRSQRYVQSLIIEVRFIGKLFENLLLKKQCYVWLRFNYVLASSYLHIKVIVTFHFL